MGIDFYVYAEDDWRFNQSIENLPFDEWQKLKRSEKVYIRESYHGCEHAVDKFSPESYEPTNEDGSVLLDWRELLPRMPEVAKACIQRELDYLTDGATKTLNEKQILNPEEKLDYGIAQLQLFMDVIKFCIAEEREGRRVIAYNSY